MGGWTHPLGIAQTLVCASRGLVTFELFLFSLKLLIGRQELFIGCYGCAFCFVGKFMVASGIKVNLKSIL